MRPLRVGLNLVFLGERAGGVGRSGLELARALAARDDVELHLFASLDAPAELTEAPWISHARLTRFPIRLDGPPLHLVAQLAGIPALAIARGLEVVHSPGAAGPVRIPRVASVVTLNDLIPLHEGDAWESADAARSMLRRALRCAEGADRVIAISQATGDDLAETAGLDLGKISVVPLGVRVPPADAVATGEPELRSRLDLGEGPVVLCVAQKRPYKNLPALVRAVAALDDDRVRLVLPGAPTPHEAELRALADQLGASHRMRFPDYVSEEELEGLYRLAACFVLPSRIEGFGLPVLEAMARGVPVACSNRSSLPEVAGDAALLFDPGDQPAIDAALARLLSDRALAAELVERGRERVAAFSWEATADGAVKAYRLAYAAKGLGR